MPGERVWVRHPDLDTCKEVARSAVAQMAGSGWVEMTAAEVKKRAKAHRDAKDAAEAAMTPKDAPEGDSTTVPPAEGATPEKEH